MRILLAVVMVAVALSLGVSNFFTSNKAKRPVAHVGSTVIPAIDFLQALEQKKDSMKQYFGRTITDQEALGLGIVSRTVSELITRELVTQEAERIGIIASEEQITKAIQKDPNFKDAQGKFSKERFAEHLSKSRLSESKYVEELRTQLGRAMLAGSLDSQLQYSPKAFSEPMYRYLKQEQDIQIVSINIDKLPDVSEPDTTKLKEFYNKHTSAFKVNEARSFNVLLLNFQTIAQTVKVTNDNLQTLYKQTNNQVPEKRSITLIPFSDYTDALHAKEELRTGSTFSSVYSRYTGDSAENAPKPQEVELKQLHQEVGSEIFSLKRVHDVTNPIYLGGNYMLFILTDIKPEKTLTFDEQKFTLLKKYKTDVAREKMYDYTQRAEKMLASGAKLHEVLTSLKQTGAVGVSMLTWSNTTQDGRMIDGTEAPGLQELDPKVLSTAFDTPQFTYSDPQKLNTDDYAIIEVTNISPPHQRTFEAAKTQVSRYWQFEQKRLKAAKITKTLEDAMKTSVRIDDLAAKNHASIDVLHKITRANMQKNQPFAGILAQVGKANIGEVSIDISSNSIQLARVLRDYPQNMETFKSSANTFSRQVILPLLGKDLLSSYIAGLEAYFPVQRNEDYFINHFGKEDLHNGPAPQAPDF